MAKQQMRVGVKVAWITAASGVVVAIIGGVFMYISNSTNDSEGKIQSVKEQKVDTGSINNYNAGRDMKIDEMKNQYNNTVQGNGNTIVNGNNINKDDSAGTK